MNKKRDEVCQNGSMRDLDEERKDEAIISELVKKLKKAVEEAKIALEDGIKEAEKTTG